MKLAKVTMILRGYNLAQVRNVARVLLNAKYVRNMEITLNSENAYDIIHTIVDEFGNKLNIGAGTVQTMSELVIAIKAGAKFVLSPRQMSAEMLSYCQKNNVISIPGSFTPSEVAAQFAKGADIVKIFPANELSLSYARKICEPMGDLKLMAVGGINKDNVYEALTSGYQYVGTAGGIFTKEQIRQEKYEAMVISLQEFENNLKNI